MDKIPSSLIFTLPVKQHFMSACFLHLVTALESVRGQGSETSSSLCSVLRPTQRCNRDQEQAAAGQLWHSAFSVCGSTRFDSRAGP